MNKFAGIVVACIAAIAFAALFGNGMIKGSSDGEKGIFLLLTIFAFVPAGFIGGAVSKAIAQDEASLIDHTQLPAVMAFATNLTACFVGVGASF